MDIDCLKDKLSQYNCYDYWTTKKDDPDFLNILNENGQSLLLVSVYNGHAILCDIIISLNLNLINLCDCEGISPLHMAVIQNYEEIVKILLEGGSDPNYIDNYNILLEFGNLKIVKLFITYGLCIDDILFCFDFIEQRKDIAKLLIMNSCLDTIYFDDNIKQQIYDITFSDNEYSIFSDLKNILIFIPTEIIKHILDFIILCSI